MADIRLAKPAAGASESIPCEPSARFVFDFPTTDATLAREGDDLNISFEDGSKLQLQDFYKEYNEENLPSFSVDGTDVTAQDFFQAMNEPDLMPAAGPGNSPNPTGARFHEWGDADLTGGIEHLNGLDWGFSRAFEWEDHPNAVGYHHDDEGDWQDAGLVAAGPEPEAPGAPGKPDSAEQRPPSPETPEVPTVITEGHQPPHSDDQHDIIIGQSPSTRGEADPDYSRMAFMLDASKSGNVSEFKVPEGFHFLAGLKEDENNPDIINTKVDGVSEDGLFYYHNQTGQWEPRNTYVGADGKNCFKIGDTEFTVHQDGSFSYVNSAGDEVQCFISHYNQPAIYQYPQLYKGLNAIGEYITDAYNDLHPGQTLEVLLEGFDVKVESYAIITLHCDENGNKTIDYQPSGSSGYMLDKTGDGGWKVRTDDYNGTTTSGKQDEHMSWDEGTTDQFTSQYVGAVNDAAAFIQHIMKDFNAKVVYNIHSSWGYGNPDYTATNYDSALELANGWLAAEPGATNQAFLVSSGGASARLEDLGVLSGIKVGSGNWMDGKPVDFTRVERYSINGSEFTTAENGSWEDVPWKPGTEATIVQLKGESGAEGPYLVINELGLVMGVFQIPKGYCASQLKITGENGDVPIVMGYVDGKYVPCDIKLDGSSYDAAKDATVELNNNGATLTTIFVGNENTKTPDADFNEMDATGQSTVIEDWKYLTKEFLEDTIDNAPISGMNTLDGGAHNDVIFGDALVSEDGHSNAEELRHLADMDEDASNAQVAQAVYANAAKIADAINDLPGGDDQIFGGAGDDVLFGMAGDDLLVGDGSRDSFADLDVAEIQNKSPEQLAGLESDLAGRESSTDGKDLLFGGTGDDVLIGGGGDDYLNGGAGQDILFGGSGNDILVGGQDASTPQTFNLAFLVDTSNPDALGDVKAQLLDAINGMKENMGENCTINVMLMGFNSYATELVCADSSDPNFYKNIEDAITALQNPVSETFRNTSFVGRAENIQDNTGGANYELAFNYASKWFADNAADGAVNKTFILAGQAPHGQISNDFPSDLSVTGTMAGTLLIANSKVDGVICKDPSFGVKGYDEEHEKIILEDYVFGQEYEVHAVNGQGEEHVLFTIGAKGMAYFKNVENDSAYGEEGYNFFWNRAGKDPLYREEGQMAGMAAPDAKNGKEYPLLAMWDQELGCWTLGYVSAMVNPEMSSSQAVDSYTQLQETCGDVTFIDFGSGTIGFPGQVEANEMDVTELGASVSNLFTVPGDTLLGGDGNDILFGDSVPDTLAALDPSEISAEVKANPHKYAGDADGDRAENDYLDGGAGNDILYGGAGNDELHGGEGDDMLFGGSGSDKLYGDAGNDYLDGGDGRDWLYGGEGDDLIVYDPSDYLIEGGEGIDFLLSSGGHGEKEYSLDAMMKNYSDNGEADMPRVNGVEVMLKGVDTGLQNMDELAAKYGFELEHKDGKDILKLREDMWEKVKPEDGDAIGDTTTYKFTGEENVTLETTLTEDPGEQAAQTIALSNG